MVDEQTTIPVEQPSEANNTASGNTQNQSSSNTGFKVIVDEVVKDAKAISTEVKKLPKKRKTMLYAGLGLMLSVVLGMFGFYFYILFGLFVPFGYGMAIVMSSYTGKDVLDEIEKNKQRKGSVSRSEIGSVEILEEDKIHETR